MVGIPHIQASQEQYPSFTGFSTKATIVINVNALGERGAGAGVNCLTGAWWRLPCADCSNTKQHWARVQGYYATSCINPCPWLAVTISSRDLRLRGDWVVTAIDTDPNIKLAIYWQQNKLESATFWTIGSRAIFRIACYLYHKKKGKENVCWANTAGLCEACWDKSFEIQQDKLK